VAKGVRGGLDSQSNLSVGRWEGLNHLQNLKKGVRHKVVCKTTWNRLHNRGGKKRCLWADQKQKPKQKKKNTNEKKKKKPPRGGGGGGVNSSSHTGLSEDL